MDQSEDKTVWVSSDTCLSVCLHVWPNGPRSQESEGGDGGVLMLGRIYNQRAQCFEKLKRWPDALEDYDRAIDAVPNGRGRAALHANRAQVHHLLGESMSILLRL